ncbi:MAG TPA: Uma2 family endonuclease [Polyangiaceae bacterium]|nr:Uma2 family endonuclease [Polyangiaceae bacterium]
MTGKSTLSTALVPSPATCYYGFDRKDARMSAAQSPRYVPYDAFLRMEKVTDNRHEWVDGIVYAMSRGTPEHGRLTGRIIARALTPLLDEGCEIFSSDTPIFVEAARHHTHADASVVCGPLVTRTCTTRMARASARPS